MTFPILGGSNPTGYFLSNSLRFRSSASAYLNRTFGTPTNNKIWTQSFWVKRGSLAATRQTLLSCTPSGYWIVEFDASNRLNIYDSNAASPFTLTTTQIVVDPSSWYHIVVAVDTTQATASNRTKVYLNGSQITSFVVANYPAQNSNTLWNSSGQIGAIASAYPSALYFDGYLAEINFIDGQALTPTSFGSFNATTGVWQPAKYTGTYGTNGFYLPFTNTASTTTLGYDLSGNSNNWTTNNISLTAGSTYDSMTDVPTLTSATVANYCVINPLAYAGSAPTVSNGNLYYAGASNSVTRSTMGFTGTKVYWEITQVSTVNPYNPISYGAIGLNGALAHNASAQSVIAYADNATGKTFYLTNSSGVSSTVTPGSFTMNPGDVLQIAYDGTTGKIWIGKNNTYYDNSGGTAGNPATGANAVFTCPDLTNPMAPGFDHAGVAYTATLNCGQQPFTYTPPTGFVALNAYNLPTGTILQGNKYMDATLWTGTGANLTITNTGAFQPDFLWIKSRTTAQSHNLVDSVRGSHQVLFSDLSGAEQTSTSTSGVLSFNSNGFLLGTDTSTTGQTNSTGQSFVGWQWQAGKGTTSSNTNGSITSTVSVNASAGFSVVTFTGTGAAGITVGHGLGVAPAFFIVKSRGTTGNWLVYHQLLGNTGGLALEQTSPFNANAGYWNNTSPTSSVFTLGTYTPSATAVAYCWTPIAGFSAFGSYTGNGSASGPFVYTGFQPRYILIKRTDSTSDWYVWDTARNTYNTGASYLLADSSSAEATSSTVNTLANGFNIVNASTVNASGGTYIYAAFASNSFKNSLAF